MDFVVSFSGLCILLALGKFLRVKVRFLQQLYLPASVIGGLLGLMIVQVWGRCSPEGVPAAVTMGWSKLPGILINIVFAALFLGVSVPPLKKVWGQAGPQLAYGQIVAWGQYVVGLGLVLILLRPLFKVEALFGVIVPVGFEGGHGTAGGLGPTFEQLGWEAGKDFGLASATAGIISAIIVGMALVNWAVRKGHVSQLKDLSKRTELDKAGLYAIEERPPAGKMTAKPDSVDTLALHLALIGVAVFIGFLIKHALVCIESAIPGLQNHEIMRAFPLFPLCMIGGLLVQRVMEKTARKVVPVDHAMMQRLGGAALDFLVIAAISTIRLNVVMAGLVPFLLIVGGGILWNVFCVMWLAKRLLPDDWFERSIAEMGQSMGVTATGLLLLRVVDPEGKSKAPAAFGYKQLLHEPFMGGGLWTSSAVLLVFRFGALPIFGVSVGAVLVWLAVWAVLFRGRRS